MAGVLNELVPQEDVAESESGGKGELVKALSFSFGENKDAELSVGMLVEQAPTQIIEEAVPV